MAVTIFKLALDRALRNRYDWARKSECMLDCVIIKVSL